MIDSHIRLPNIAQNAPQSFLWACSTILVLILAAGCIRPAPPTPAPTIEPYPAPVYAEIGHQAYPGPIQPGGIEASDMPTCIGNIEYPSSVWQIASAPDDMFSETCIWSQMAGSNIILFDTDGSGATQVTGQRIGVFPPNCQRYRYRLGINGTWYAQVMVSDPGGVNLCYVAPGVFERNRHLFIEMWR